MLAAMLTLLAIGTVLLVTRWRDVPRRALSEALLSRDTAFVLLMLTFVIIAGVIAFGTSMPWITSIKGLSDSFARVFGRAFNIDNGTQFGGQPFTDGRFSLMPDFFKRTTSPLGLVLVTLMAVGPLLGWRGTNGRKLLLSLRWPFIAAVILTSVGIVLGVRDGMSLAYLTIASFALGSNLLMIIRTLRSGWLRIGGYLAHVGMALLLVGVVGSYAYASPEEKLVIPQGETQCMFGHCFTFWGYDEKPDGKHVLRLEVDRNSDRPFVASPDVYFNARMGAEVRTPAIKRYLWQDLYIAPEQYLPAVNLNAAEVVPGVQQEIGPYSVRFDGFDVQDHLAAGNYAIVQATVTVTHENQVNVMTPQLRLEADKAFTEIPVPLTDGRSLVLENINPGAQMAKLRIDGLNLPPLPARAVFTVSIKPAIALVWLGTLLMSLGGFLAVVRRRLEHAPARVAVRSEGGGIIGSRALGWRGTYR
jgi:cytochrome c-type biogenesis protein CcmF